LQDVYNHKQFEKGCKAMRPKLSLMLLSCLAIRVTIADAQTAPSTPFSADLARYYFASPEAEIAARTDVDSALKRLRTFHGQINSGERLLNALQSYEDVQKIYRRHETYLRLRCSQSRKDSACASNAQLGSEVNAATAFLFPEILAIPEAQLQAFQASEPGLKPYQFALEDIRRDSAHMLPGTEEAFLDRLQPETTDWQYDLYEQILAGISFGTVDTPAGPLDIIRQRNLLASHADASVREEAFKRRLAGYAGRRDLLAFALIHTVKTQEALAQLHRYPDAPTRKYTNMYLEPRQTRRLLDAMAQHGDVVKRFEKIRAGEYQPANHAQFHVWDLAAPPNDFNLPITSLADAPGIYHQAFAGLGAEYQQAFDALLNPLNGRADVLPGGAPNRYAGGFSTGFAGNASMLFIGRYDGTFKDLSVIAHEGGHAAHRSFMSANNVQPLYANGPSFLFESFAAFNELVLADYLAEHSSDPRMRRYYLEQWMGIKGLDAFYGAQDALLEQQLYDGVSKGNIRNADDLDKLTLQVDEQFSLFPATTPELRNRWATLSLMYEDPLYNINYVYGGLLALKYYQLYTADRERFLPRYITLLKNGFNAPPGVLLQQFLNINLFDDSLLKDDLTLLNRRLAQLETVTTN
jgi:oligoendopeptidase F